MSHPLEISVRDGARLHLGDEVSVTFQRTLRIPDDGRHYPLPPGLGTFPVRRVDDYADRVPADWREQGGVFLPMYQREALWICFGAPRWRPRAVKVAVGKVCAITGERWTEGLHIWPRQNYLVVPDQPWLDGIAAGQGVIRQFVAMPLGMGYTVEGQVTGEERFGGIQLKVFEPRPARFPDPPPVGILGDLSFGIGGVPAGPEPCSVGAPSPCRRSRAGAMGLAAGGQMRQKIYPDRHGVGCWDESRTARVFVHIVNSELWREITGEAPPASPVTAREYAAHGLPWFDLYDEGVPTVAPTKTLKKVKSVRQIDAEKSALPLQDDEPVEPGPVRKLLGKVARGLGVRDGSW